MFPIPYRALNGRLKKAILARQLSLADLQAVREKIVADNRKDLKKYWMTVLLVLVFILISAGLAGVLTHTVRAALMGLGVMAGVWALGAAVCYCTVFLIIKHQFNSAVKKAYPECSEELRV